MNSSRSKEKKLRRKVIIRCRKLSSTSYRNQTSCSCGSAPYKQRMKVMSKNNKELATSLQGIRCDLANKEKYLNNMMFARVQMLKMRSSMTSFMKDFDQVLVLLNTDNTEWPVLGCSLQSNEFKNKMNNVIETVEEVSEPESSFAAPRVSNKITDMTVEEIVAKAVLNSQDSKNDQDSAAVNHTSTTPMPESKVLKEAVFNEELSIDALSRRKGKQVGTSAIHLPSPAFKSYSSLGKSSDLKSGFSAKITVSPSSAKNILADPSAEKSKKSKIPKIHNVLNKAKKKSSMSRKTSRDKQCLKEIITKNTENVVKESKDSRRLNFVKDSDTQVPDFTSSNDILEVPSSMKLSDEVPSILQEPDKPMRRQTFIVKDLKSQCDRRKTFVKTPQDMDEMFISSKDRRETFTISNKIDENNEGCINHGIFDATHVCESVTAKAFKNGVKPKIGIIKALHSVNDGVLNNLDAVATDSQVILTEVFAVENIPSLDSIQKMGSDICEVDKNIKQSKKLSVKKCSELQEKAENPEAACVNKVVDFELDLCKETADNSEATSAKLIGSELNLCTAKTDHHEAACAKLCCELDLCQKKLNNPEVVCVKLTGSELNHFKEKADNSETACGNLMDSGSDLCKKKTGNHRAVCAKLIGSEVTEINMDKCAAFTDDTSQKLKSTGNVKRLGKVSRNSRDKSVEGEIDMEKRVSHCNFKRKLDKQFLSSESDGETIQEIDLDSLEVPPLKITPVIRRFPKGKNGKVFVFHGNKRKSILSKVSKNVSKLPSDAVCQSNDSSGNINKLNISDASLISRKNFKNSQKSVSFCFSSEIDKIDTLCTEDKEFNNSTIQQNVFKPSYVESIENVIKECGEVDRENNFSDNCSPMFDIEIDQSEKIPTKRISSEMECKENVQSKDADADDPNFIDWFESICKDIVKPAEIKIKKRKTNYVNKKSKRGASKKKAIRIAQEDVIFPNKNGSNVVKDDQGKIETKKIESRVKKYLPVNTFVVEAEIHPPPPSTQDENEMPLQLNNLRLSVVLSDIFKSEDGETLNIPCNKDAFLKGSTNFPLTVPLSENAVNVKSAVDDLRKDIPVIDLDSEKFEDLTDARCRRSRKAVTYKEPLLNKKMRRLK